MQTVSRGQQRGQHCIVADIAQSKVDEPGAIPACGHETLKVVVLGADHEIEGVGVKSCLLPPPPLAPRPAKGKRQL